MFKLIFIIITFININLSLASTSNCASVDSTDASTHLYCVLLTVGGEQFCTTDSKCYWAANGSNACIAHDSFNLADMSWCNVQTTGGEMQCLQHPKCFWVN